VGVSQTLRRWTEGATYIRQGGHQAGHWPTFLVVVVVAYLTWNLVPLTTWNCCTRIFVIRQSFQAPSFVLLDKCNLQHANRIYQTSPALCTPITPFPADRPHHLRSEFSEFLLALAWHTEWSLLLHDVIGDWMIPFAANATATAVATIANAFEWPGQPAKLPLPLGISSPCRRRIEPRS